MELKTPGVFIVEKNAFPNSVVEVASAVPAFVGYTEFATNKGKSLRGRPWRITSMAEYAAYFGDMPAPRLHIDVPDPAAATPPATDEAPGQSGVVTHGGQTCRLRRDAGRAGGRQLLPQSMRHFFQNGGGACYVVSIGGFDDELGADALLGGISALTKEQEPTMLVVPDAVLLPRADCTKLQQAMLAHVGRGATNRFAILDVWGGDCSSAADAASRIDAFRADLPADHRDHAAVYFPWLHTTVVQEAELDHRVIVEAVTLAALLKAELKLPAKDDATLDAKTRAKIALIDRLVSDGGAKAEPDLHKSLLALSPLYGAVLAEARRLLNVMPPSPAMAGVYTMVDNTRGVWKAPANVSLDGVVAPTVALTDGQQQDLNAAPQGASVNAIRSFIGQGVLVWGARTLDGNSQDWRYVNVRRTVSMVEDSCRLALRAYVFEPNDANTWVTVRSMLDNYLMGLWKRGGLMGSAPDQAFAVQCGLGQTMTAQDVAAGTLRASVLLAVVRPAEFIVLSFEQQQAAAP